MIPEESKVPRAESGTVIWTIAVSKSLGGHAAYNIGYQIDKKCWTVNIIVGTFERLPERINLCCDLLGIPHEYPGK